MRDGYCLDLRTWRGRGFLGVLIFLISWSSSFLSNFIHEFLGHGLATLLFGGGFHGFYLSPIATSASYLSGPPGAGFPPLIEGIISASGVIAQFILGGLPLILLPRLKTFPSKLTILTFSWTCLLNAGTYLFDSTATALLYDIRGTALDSVGMSVHWGIPLESFLALGFIASSLPTYHSFTQFIGIMEEHHLVERRDYFPSLMTVFFATRTIMVLAGFLLEPAPEFYLVELAFTLFLLASHAALVSLKGKPLRPQGPPEEVALGRFVEAVCLSAVVTTLLWIVVFGASVDVAHGIFFDDIVHPSSKN